MNSSVTFWKKDGCTLDWTFRPFRRRREMLQWPTLWFPHSPFALWGGEQWIKFWTMGNWVAVSNNLLKFSPLLGEMIQFEKYLSNGLKPPTRKSLVCFPVERQPFPGGPLAVRMRQERFYAVSIRLVLFLTLFPSRFIESWQVRRIFLLGPNCHEALSRVVFWEYAGESSSWPVRLLSDSIMLSNISHPPELLRSLVFFLDKPIQREDGLFVFH